MDARNQLAHASGGLRRRDLPRRGLGRRRLLDPTGGGCGHAHDVKLVYHYNPQTRVWQSGPSLPEALNHPAMVSDGAHLYVLGGFGADGQAVASVFRLDSPAGRWRPDRRSLPGPRGAGAAAWDGTRILFAGGAEGGGTPVRGDVWALTPNQWATIGHLQQARKHLAGASDGHGTVWFVGGKERRRRPLAPRRRCPALMGSGTANWRPP